MAANCAYLDAEPGRYVLVLPAGRAEQDHVPPHGRQSADGLPDQPQVLPGLNLVLESRPGAGPFGGVAVAAIGGAKILPAPVRGAQDLESLIEYHPHQVRALLLRRFQAPDPVPGAQELEAAVLNCVFR